MDFIFLLTCRAPMPAAFAKNPARSFQVRSFAAYRTGHSIHPQARRRPAGPQRPAPRNPRRPAHPAADFPGPTAAERTAPGEQTEEQQMNLEL